MSIWTPPPWAALVAGKAWTAAKARAAFENVMALAEGAAGSPKVVGKALDIDAGNLVGTAAITGLDDAAKILLVATSVVTSAVGASPSPSIGYQLSSNNGASWGPTVVLASYNLGLSSGDGPVAASASGTSIINMTGFNAIRLSGAGTLSGSAIWVEGE